MSKRITIKEIAKALNVSISTVSKALNDSYEISEETKKRINDYAKKHKYKPNTLALSLQNKKTKTIGILIPDILNHFFARVIRGIEKVANDRGYNILTCITNESLDKEKATIEMLSNGTIDGFIASLSQETMSKEDFTHFKDVIEDGTPVVLFDRVHKDIICDKIVTDNIKSAYKATRYLMKSNCKNIAFISAIDNLTVGKFREKGYRKALTTYNVPINEDLMVCIDNKISLRSEITKLLKNHPEIDGIFTVDEISGAVTTQVINQMEIRIPDQISIIGFTNGILAKYTSPPLTTVNPFAHTTGEIAANRLIDKIEGKIPYEDIITEIVPTELIERESTKKMFIKF